MTEQSSIAAVIFDFNRTLFDPTVYALYSGVVPMLEELQGKTQLILFSKKSWDRHLLLDKLGISKYFNAAHFVERKTPESLRGVVDEHELDARQCVIVGDMLTEEICAGSELGMKTVWFQQSRFGAIFGTEDSSVCVPDHTAHSIEELRALLRKL